MNDKDHIHSLLVSLWDIQNSILQSARGIFLTVESILFSLAMTIPTSKHNLGFVLELFVLGIMLTRVWRLIVRDRGYNDSYLRCQILKVENGKPVSEKALTDFRAWQKKTITQKHSELSSDDLCRQLLLSSTRKILDVHLPNIFFVLWVFFLGYWIFVTYYLLRTL